MYARGMTCSIEVHESAACDTGLEYALGLRAPRQFITTDEIVWHLACPKQRFSPDLLNGETYTESGSLVWQSNASILRSIVKLGTLHPENLVAADLSRKPYHSATPSLETDAMSMICHPARSIRFINA